MSKYTSAPSPGGEGGDDLYRQLYLKGQQLLTRGEYVYAIDCFKRCALRRGNIRRYAEALLFALQKKYGENQLRTMTKMLLAARQGILNSLVSQASWEQVRKQAIRILEIYPYHVPTLIVLAQACGQLGFDQTELVFCEAAWKLSPDDPELNAHYGDALKRHEHVENDPTNARGHLYEKMAALRQAIQADPTNLSTYLELAEVLVNAEQFEEAITVIREAQATCPPDEAMRDQLELIQLRILRERVDHLRREARRSKSKSVTSLSKFARKILLLRELRSYQEAVDRYPNNVDFRFSYAERLYRLKMYIKAAYQYQLLLSDEWYRETALMRAGVCFYRLGQYEMALQHFLQRVDGEPDSSDLLAPLYATGVTALRVEEHQLAREHLTRLVHLDSSYRGVIALLLRVK